MLVYHVVTERPMHAGQRIVFDENNRSGVWQRVMARLPQVEDVYANPEKYPVPLEHHLDVALRELALEEVRLSKYPERPSRMACLYVSSTLEEAERWAAYFVSLGRPVFGVAELEVGECVFAGNACLCFDGVPDRAANLAMAERYWRLDPCEDGEIRELLVGGEILVKRIIRDDSANLAE